MANRERERDFLRRLVSNERNEAEYRRAARLLASLTAQSCPGLVPRPRRLRMNENFDTVKINETYSVKGLVLLCRIGGYSGGLLGKRVQFAKFRRFHCAYMGFFRWKRLF